MPWPFALPITLSDADRVTLVGWTRRPKTAQALALRARIILAAAAPGTTNTAISRGQERSNLYGECFSSRLGCEHIDSTTAIIRFEASL